MRSVIFTAQEIQALHSNRKTQFREPLAQPPIGHQLSKPISIAEYLKLLDDARKKGYETLSISRSNNGIFLPKCPFGAVGDVLFVQQDKHAPQNNARFYLKIKDVRIERLHEITSQDAHAEGATNGANIPGLGKVKAIEMIDLGKDQFKRIANFKVGYYQIFTSKYAPELWDENPWVWVVEFEQCKKPRKINRISKQTAQSV